MSEKSNRDAEQQEKLFITASLPEYSPEVQAKEREQNLEGERKASEKYIRMINLEIDRSDRLCKGQSKTYIEGYKDGLIKAKQIIRDITIS